MNKIYIYGASGHGLVVADIAKLCGYKEVIYVDDGDNDNLSFEDIRSNNKIPLAFGIGDNNVRHSLFEKVIKSRFEVVTLVHPSAIISPSVTIGIGSVVMANVIINAKSKIGKCVILNSSSIIEHENIIEEFTHISPAVALSGNVTIEAFTHIGIGSCIKQGITVGKNCIVGAGSTVLKNIEDNKMCFGTPCKIIRNK